MTFGKLLTNARLAQLEHVYPPLTVALAIKSLGVAHHATRDQNGMDYVSDILDVSSFALDVKSEEKYFSQVVKLVQEVSPDGVITRTQKLLAEGK